MFGRVGGPSPNADLFLCGEFGRFAAGTGNDAWTTGTVPNDTITTSVGFRAGIAFAGGPAFVVGDNGTAYRQALHASSEWLRRYFDLDTPDGARVRQEIDALSAVDIDPPRPTIGAAATALRRSVQAGTSNP